MRCRIKETRTLSTGTSIMWHIQPSSPKNAGTIRFDVSEAVTRCKEKNSRCWCGTSSTGSRTQNPCRGKRLPVSSWPHSNFFEGSWVPESYTYRCMSIMRKALETQSQVQDIICGETLYPALVPDQSLSAAPSPGNENNSTLSVRKMRLAALSS